MSVDLFREILRTTHQEGKCRTFYANICDLKAGVIYLYYGGEFEKVVELNLQEQLKKGKREIKMAELLSRPGKVVRRRLGGLLSSLGSLQPFPDLLCYFGDEGVHGFHALVAFFGVADGDAGAGGFFSPMTSM